MFRLLMIFLALSLPDIGNRYERNVVTRYCDMMEVNSHIDSKGEHLYDQIIYWEWNPELKKMVVCCWELVRDDGGIPSRVGKRYRFKHQVRGESRSVIIYSDLYRRTKSHIDPEKENKKIFSEEKRRNLFRKVN